MESWVLEGDSYSFLSSAPRTFNLQNRDRPNRVEIFDITRIPSQRSVISETTCLCDIFGDDGEALSLSSSPASKAIFKREVDEVTPVDDTTDSSGSYHTANDSEQSSESSDKFNESRGALPCTLETDLNSSASVTAPSDGLDTSKPLQKADYLESDSSPQSTGVSSDSQGVNSFSLTEASPINEPLSSGVISPINAFQREKPEKNSIQPQPTATYISETENGFSSQDDFRDLGSPLDRTNICPIPVFSIIPESRDSPLLFETIGSADKIQEGKADTIFLSEPKGKSSSSEAWTASFVNEQNITASYSEELFEVNHIEKGHTIPSNDIRGTISTQSEVVESKVLPNSSSSESTVSTELSSPEATAVASLPELKDIANISSPESILITNPPEHIEVASSLKPKVTSSSEVEDLPYLSTPEPTVPTKSPEPTLLPTFYSPEPPVVTSSGIPLTPTGINLPEPELATNLTTPEPIEIVNLPEPELAVHFPLSEPTEIVNSLEPELAANFTSSEPIDIANSPELELAANFPSPELIEVANLPESKFTANFNSPEPTEIFHSQESEFATNSNSPEPTEIFHSQEPVNIANFASLEHSIISDSPKPETVAYFSSPEPTTFSCSSDSSVASSAEPITDSDLSGLVSEANSPEPRETDTLPESTERAVSTEPITFSPEPIVITTTPEPKVITTLPDHLVSPNPSESIVVSITPEPILISISPKTINILSTPEPTKINQSPEPTIITPEFVLKSPSPMFNRTCVSPEIRVTYSDEPRATPSPSEDVRMSYFAETRAMSSSPHSGHAASPLDSRRTTLTPEMSTTTQTNRRNLSPELINRTPSPYRSTTTSPQETGLTHSVVSSDRVMTESPEIRGITCSVLPNEMKHMAQSPDRLSVRSPESSSLLAETRNTTPFSELKDICSSPELNNVTPEPERCVSECSLELWSPSSPSAVKDTASSPDVQNRTLSPDVAATNYSPIRTYSPGQRGLSSSPEERYVGVSPAATSPISEGHHLSPISAKSGASPSTEIHGKGQQVSPLSFKSKSTSPLFERELQDELQEQEMCGLDPHSNTVASPTHQYSPINLPDPSPESLRKYPTPRQVDTDKMIEMKSESIHCENPSNSIAWSHSEIASKVDQHSCWEENERRNPEAFERQSVGVKARHRGLTCRESPTVSRGDGSGEYDCWPWQDREEGRNREGEEGKASVQGEGRSREAGYRGEQVELSFSARNRKGPASYSTAPTSRDPKLGIPSRGYSEWLLATRQQQSKIRAQTLQQENKAGARRLKPVPRSNNTGPGRFSTDHTSETSSMGSEFDEADSEVKWLTDVAFSSLSSPQVDYLDMYNSSHRSSTNASQPSTQESPGATAWLSYADLRGSGQGEGDDVSHQPSYVPPLGALDPSRRFELGSFECVDVALESKEEARKGKRTVPKRQIQLKRRDNNEPTTKENMECALDSPSMERLSKDTFVRQHSTPVTIEEDMTTDDPETDQPDRKQKMHKSLSLDETSSKTKIASCLLKNVLSKKMQSLSNQTTHDKEDLSPSEDISKPFESTTPPPEREDSKPDNDGSSQISDNSLPPVKPPDREEQSPPQVAKQQRGFAPKVPPKPLRYTLPPLPQDISTRPEPQDKKTVRKGSPLDATTEGRNMEKRKPEYGGQQAANGNLGGKHSSDSANVSVGNTGTTATRALGMPSGMINRDQERRARPENHKQHSGRSMFMSKTPEIMLKPCTPKERKKQSSVKVSLSPTLERKAGDSQEKVLEEKQEEPELEAETEPTEDECDTNKIKKPMHKVRDVRRLVKNTYNLSFKAAAPAESPQESEPQSQEETVPVKPAPMQIQCKAISRKENKEPSQESDKPADTSKTAVDSTDMKAQTGSPHIPPKATQANKLTSALPSKEQDPVAPRMGTNTVLAASSQVEKVSNETGRHPKPSSSPQIPSKVSKMLFQPDGSSKGIPNPDAPPSPRLAATSSSHSVSMILKEKGMQADIGVCDVVSEASSNPRKHINRIEVPLQTSCMDDTLGETPRKEVDSARNSAASSPRLVLSADKTVSKHGTSPKPQEQDKNVPKVTFEENQPSLSRKVQGLTDLVVPEVVSISKETASPVATSKSQLVTEVKPACGEANVPALQKKSKEIELPIQVRSISYDRPKPVLPTKPSCKQPLIEIRSISNEKTKGDKQQPAVDRNQGTEERKFEAVALGETMTKPAPPVHTNKLAVSARSSYRPPPNKMAAVSSLTQKTATDEYLNDKQIHEVTTSQASKTQMPTVATSRVPGQPIILYKPYSGASNMPGPQEQVMPASTSGSVQTVEPLMAQAPSYTQQLAVKSPGNQAQREDLRFYASDDPPSYDDRESFSPYLLPDLASRRANRYHPNSRPPPCSCSSTCSSHPGHPRLSPHTRTPPMAPHSPGQSLPYPGVPPQAQVRPHQCRPDGQPLTYKPGSPKAPMLNPTQPPAMFQPLHPPPACPGPLLQPCGEERQPPPGQHGDRRPAHHPTQQQQQPPGASSGPYSDHLHPSSMPPMESRPQYLCSPQDLASSYGPEYGSDGTGGGNVMYPDSAGGLGYGQGGPRRVLLDPDTGKYFYIEVPMQPLRKMLFDPETGQYVEVLIPQQALSHSGLYPPPAAPYSSLHGPSMYAPQYLPYPVPTHPQATHPPRNPEPPVPTTLHQNSMGYGTPGGQVPKSELQNQPPLDQGYLESMYYIPTGMNASPNPTPSDCYHKPSNLPTSGSRRS
ncbi:hypothetical protein AALO_G00263590 [Alosa alosa]|uniref:DUF4585 domain-containing protein n=1 Tax=Alosa alosa TaxID=278164 RepID=A0AAV6FL78_9TELE|nr:mucin-17 [Alosa alosa]XP_048086845.1 mucin-17 [Alosa alosa]KAG5263320.1 hypothetical protein AALO_G00263590 [Alosa alosa]